MNAAMDEFAFQAAGKGLDLSCERAADIPQILLGNPVRVQHILTNLIANAMRPSTAALPCAPPSIQSPLGKSA